MGSADLTISKQLVNIAPVQYHRLGLRLGYRIAEIPITIR